MNKKTRRRVGLTGLTLLTATLIWQPQASANFLNGLTNGFLNKFTSEATDIAGNAFQRITGVSFNKLQDDVLTDVFGKHPDAKLAQKNRGELGLPDPLKQKTDLEQQILDNPAESTGVNDLNGSINVGERVRESGRLTSKTYSDIQLSSDHQAAEKAALDNTQEMVSQAAQIAQEAQNLTVTQDVAKANIAVSTVNGQLLSAILAQQHQNNTTGNMALGQLSEINRHLEVMAKQDNTGITNESAQVIRDSAGTFF